MLLRRIARPLLAGIFIYGGIGALRDPESHAQAAKPMLDTAKPVLDRVVGFVPIDRAPSPATMVKVDAGIKIGAGVLLALGRAPRLASTALAASLIPTTLAGHRFWEIEDPRDRSDQLIHFLKNLGLLGGLIIAAADTAGRPSLAWRGRRAGRLAAAASQRKLAEMTTTTDRAGGKISGLAAGATGLAAGAAGRASKLTTDVVGTATEQGRTLAGKAARLGEEAAGKAARLGEEAAGKAARLGEEAVGKAARLGEEAASKATSMGDDMADALADAAAELRGRLKTMAR